MKIDILIGDNPYATTTHFAQGLGKALEHAGCRVRSFFIGRGEFYKAFYAIREDRPDFTCSFSDVTFGEKIPLGDAWGIPHLSLLVDHAIYFIHQLRGKFSHIGAMDEEDVAYMHSQGFSNIFHFPHGIDSNLTLSPSTERPYDIVFLGTCLDYERIASLWSSAHRKLLLEASERVLASETTSCLQVLLESNVGDELPYLHQELEKYVKGKSRIEMLQALASLNIHIWGNGRWKKYLPQTHVHGSVSYEKALKIMSEAKIVLNSAPCHKFSSHERIFQPLALGALTVTTPTAYVRKHFIEGETIVTSLSDVPLLLHNETRRREIVQAGQHDVLKKETWDQRAKLLLEVLASQVV